MNFHPEVELTEEQAQLIARGLLAVARCDGSVDVREVALIDELTGGESANLPDIDPDEVGEQLASALAPVFLKSCLLVALADQKLSDAERALITSYANALSVSMAELDAFAQSVKEYLLGPLVKLSNVEAVAELGRKLDV